MQALFLALVLCLPAGGRQAASWRAGGVQRIAALDSGQVRFGDVVRGGIRPTRSADAAGIGALAAVTWRGRPQLMAVRGPELLRWDGGWQRLVEFEAPILQVLPDTAGALVLAGLADEPAPREARLFRLPADSAKVSEVAAINPAWRASRLGWALAGERRRLVVTTWKPTRFLPIPHRCLFVFDWSDGRAAPWWLGSRLSRPFREALHGLPGRDGVERLVAIEELVDGRPALSVYRPIGFGYQGEAELNPVAGLRHLLRLGPVVLAWGQGEDGPWWARIELGESLRLEPMDGAPPDPTLPTDIGNGSFAGFWHSRWQVGYVQPPEGGS